jgi:ABC-type bacteriocin/lantibiotic exporter with double-glycine peptidase domain
MLFWEDKLDKVHILKDVKKAPNYAHEFFWRHKGPFSKSFYILTIISVLIALLGFGTTYIVNELVSNIDSIETFENLTLYFLLPYLAAKTLSEILSYFVRKYSEAFPLTFTDYIRSSLYKTVLNSSFHKLYGYSKIKLDNISNRYLTGVESFLNSWVWGIPQHFTNLILVIAILAYQNPVILLINLVYFVLFLIFALRISKRFGKITKEFSEVSIETGSKIGSFALNMNSVKRLLLSDFFIDLTQKELNRKWINFKEIRDFHAWRWFIQLNIYNLVFVGTLFFGAYQVMNDQLELGFLILLTWAYGRLWGIIVFIIEYYVQLIEQKENAKIFREEIKQLLEFESSSNKQEFPGNWEKIKFDKVKTRFEKDNGNVVEITVPKLEIQNGSKIGITGKSGSGKSTIINLLLGLINYSGDIKVDGRAFNQFRLDRENICLISNSEQIFDISLRKNIVLDNEFDSKRFEDVLKGLKLKGFVDDPEVVLGSKNVSFSTGQEQRIRLARGIYQDADIYLFDEALNGIDSKNKGEILDYLKNFFKDKTVIFISHIEADLELVDQCYHIYDGVLKTKS